MIIGEKIKIARKAKGLTQKQLSEIADVAEITIRQYETNKRQPKIEQLQKIADSLGCTVDYLLGKVDAPNIRLATQADFDNFSGDGDAHTSTNLSAEEYEAVEQLKRLPPEQRVLVEADIKLRYSLYVEQSGDLQKFRKQEVIKKLFGRENE